VREYLSAGLPVATNVAGSDLKSFEEFVEKFEPGDPISFARALECALKKGENPGARAKIGVRWSWDAVAKRFLKELSRREAQK
jgi:glycosyltransferase involved in cell wall biosynthesis